MLIVLSGLPGTGKTTIARALLARRAAAYVRIDVIEQALNASKALAAEVGPAGYVVGYALARSNLQLGQNVVVDCVNPLDITRATWRQLATEAASPVLEFELVCSNIEEHRRRVEQRVADIPGHTLPTWASVMAHDYAAWNTPRTIIDTAETSAQDAAAQMLCQWR